MANNRRRLVGVVLLERRKMHPIYKKVVVSTKKIMAHDETDQIPVGAVVRVVESRPISKNKRWVVEEVLETPEVFNVNKDLGEEK